ncbi:MAG: Hsp20/alpha crystallin family protein [Planctomycetales bacterium]
MNLLTRFGGRIWDPWREMGTLQREVNRLLAGARAHSLSAPREFPSVNLYANDHDLMLTMELPGIDPASIDVTVTGDGVTISGEKPADAAQTGENFHRRERASGKFSRALHLPFEVEPSRTEAAYEKGVLKVRMTRPDAQKPRKVSIKPA